MTPTTHKSKTSHFPDFKRVVLYARQHRANQGVNETLIRLVKFLHSQPVEVLQDHDTANYFDLDIPLLPRNQMRSDLDLIVVVGGDGSLLSAARMAINANVPVIGINRGQLGFLTDISPNDMEVELGAILKGEYQEETRFLLKTHAQNSDSIGTALNDVVLSCGNNTHLIDFEVYINQQFVTHYRSDGLILSTPTGSTAYALSAGGPILHPQLNAMVMVPMFSHSLSSRPLVVDGEAVVELYISRRNEIDLQVSCDGHESQLIKPGQSVTIQKHEQKLRLLHPKAYHYYDTLRIKLGWGAKSQSLRT